MGSGCLGLEEPQVGREISVCQASHIALARLRYVAFNLGLFKRTETLVTGTGSIKLPRCKVSTTFQDLSLKHCRTGERGAFHASLSPRPSINSPSYPSDLTINPGTTFPYFNTVTVPWPQQASSPFATIPLPFSPQPEQARNVLQDYTRNANMYYQNYQMATSAPDAILPTSDSIQGEEHELVSYMSEMGPSYVSERAPSFISDMQPSHVPVEGWPKQDSGSTVRDHTPKDRKSSRKDYA